MHMSFKQLVFRPDTVVNLLEAQFEDQCATGADLKGTMLLGSSWSSFTTSSTRIGSSGAQRAASQPSVLFAGAGC